MHIDEIDISALPQQQFRSLLTTLPQEPVKLPGTVQQNPDAEDNIQADEPLIEALRKTHVRVVVWVRRGLDAGFGDLGLSVGRQ